MAAPIDKPTNWKYLTIEEKLECLIEDQGYCVKFFAVAKGYWTHLHQEVMKWEAYVTDQSGNQRHIGCWNKMSDCVKRGFTISEGGGHHDLGCFVAEKSPNK